MYSKVDILCLLDNLVLDMRDRCNDLYPKWKTNRMYQREGFVEALDMVKSTFDIVNLEWSDEK